MQEIDISKARVQLPELLDAAINGADILITQDNQPLVRISRVDPIERARALDDSLETHVPTRPLVTAIQAQALANLFLSDHLPDRFMGDTPTLDTVANVWHVPVLLAYAVIGPVGQTGEILVSAMKEEIVSYTPFEEMKVAARRLYEENRDAIEAPVP